MRGSHSTPPECHSFNRPGNVQSGQHQERPVFATCPPTEGVLESPAVVASRRCGGKPQKENHLQSPQKSVTPDVLVSNVGTLYTFCPLTLRAKEWIDEHVQDDAQWFGHALIVEHRYAWGLAQGMKDEGLVLA